MGVEYPKSMCSALARLANLQALSRALEHSGEVTTSVLEPELGKLEELELEAHRIALTGHHVGQRIARLLVKHDDTLLESYTQADEDGRSFMLNEVLTGIRAAQRSAAMGHESEQPWSEMEEAGQMATVRAAVKPLYADLSPSIQDAFDEDLRLELEEFVQRRRDLLGEASELQTRLEARAESESLRLSSAVMESLRRAEVSKLQCGVDGLYTPVESPQQVWASAWIEAPREEPQAFDLLICADISGSMRPRLAALKATLGRIVDHMKASDRLCVVAFNHTAEVLVDWTQGTAEGKLQLQAVFTSLNAGGGTRFGPALETCFEQVSRTVGSAARGSPRPVRIVLLSDGESEEPSDLLCKQLMRRFSPLGASFCAVGYSSASDAQLLRQLSRCGRGPFLYADSAQSAQAALGRLSAWAEECSYEGFAILRGLGECSVLEMESGLGSESLTAGCQAVMLGPLVQGKARALALKIQLPESAPDLNTPLFDCTFVLWRPGQGPLLSSCTLRAMQVPSLLVEGLTGIPVRVSLAEEFSEFTSEKQDRVLASLSQYWHMPRTAITVDSVRSGSVILDVRLLVPPSLAAPLLEAFDASAVEDELRSKGFPVNYVMVPGQQTARRVLQWASADVMSDLASGMSPDSMLKLRALAGGQLGEMDPGTARSVLEDLEAALQTEQADAQHRLLQLEASHCLAFPAAPEDYAALRGYDTAAIRARGSGPGRSISTLGVIQDLTLTNASFESLDIEFLGIVSPPGEELRYLVSAAEVRAEESGADAGPRSWEVPGSGSSLVELELSGLKSACAYLVTVRAICPASGRQGQTCPARLMCTLPDMVTWTRVGFGSSDSWQVIELEWTGKLHGSAWTVSLNQESSFRSQGGAGLSVSKSTITSKPRWTVQGSLDRGVYRVDVEDPDGPLEGILPTPTAKGSRTTARVRARCWVLVGPWDKDQVSAKLQEKYGLVCQFAENVLVAAPDS